MKAAGLIFVLAAAAAAQAEDWKLWTPRDEIAPRAFRESGLLALSGNSNPAAYGCWQREVNVEAGRWYRFRARYRARGVSYPRLQVLSRLDWVDPRGRRAGQPDYAYAETPEGEWTRVTLDAPAPQQASAVKLQLFLQNAPAATVWWDDVSFEPVPSPKPRPVRVAAVNLRPVRTHSAAESVERFMDLVGRGVPENTDIVLLPEGITVVGNGKKYADVAEAIPGPTTARLGEMARRKNAYIVAGIYEREAQAIYNTAVLIDRKGEVAGKYRKVYLPREEMEGGITPGSDYPVYQTDFGKIGMMICWDVQYTDPARALALSGAELILMPIWGGNLTLGRARAIENHVFLASSGYDYPTMILDPSGETVASVEPGGVATATLDLSRRYDDKWLGDMRERFMKEVRLDLPAGR